MWSLMLAMVVAWVVSNLRSVAAEVATLARASRYSGGGWVSLQWWWIATFLVKPGSRPVWLCEVGHGAGIGNGGNVF